MVILGCAALVVSYGTWRLWHGKTFAPRHTIEKEGGAVFEVVFRAVLPLSVWAWALDLSGWALAHMAP